MASLFVYGALMYDEVWKKIVIGEFDKVNGKLTGYRRLKVRNEEYPGLVKGNREVAGIIWLNVDEDNLKRLDTFEAEYYQRVEGVATDANGKEIKAYFYVFKDEYIDLLENIDWNVKEFEKTGLRKFRSEYIGFNRV